MTTATMEYQEALFGSAHAALTFAFNFSGQAYDRPMMNRMAAPSIGTGKGLSGLDGAAQAGMVRAELRALGPLYEACLIAKVAPQGIPCECTRSCCSGTRANPEWQEAIGTLTKISVAALAGCVSHYRLRQGIIHRCFGEKTTLQALADLCDVSRDLANDHNAKVVTWLKGAPTRRGQQPIVGVEQQAWEAIEMRLRDAGMVGA